jgi:hypothetical protein
MATFIARIFLAALGALLAAPNAGDRGDIPVKITSKPSSMGVKTIVSLMTLAYIVNSLGLEAQSVIARVSFPTRVTRGFISNSQGIG